MRSLLAAVLALLAALVAMVGAATASAVDPVDPTAQGSVLSQDFAANPSQIDVDLTPLKATTGSLYFWANQFTIGDNEAYIGLQSNTPKLALFSMWNSNGFSGAACKPFDGEGIGNHCVITYNWQLGRTYRLRVTQGAKDSQGQWWTGSVLDRTSGVTTTIGQLRSPTLGKAQPWADQFTEYFGDTLTSCSAQPYSMVRWSNLIGQGTRISATRPTLYGGNCENARFTTESSSSYIQEAGTVGPYYSGAAQICNTSSAPYYTGAWTIKNGINTPPSTTRAAGNLAQNTVGTATAKPGSTYNQWKLANGTLVTVARKYECPYGK